LDPIADRIKAAAAENHLRLIWYTPTQYCEFNPLEKELGVKGCTAAKYNMCVEPNGDVIPCQSYYQALGNILADPWESIWQHQLAQDLRDRTWLPAKCQGCEDVAVCGGGCPLYVKEGEYLCVESQSTAP
jgi:radical SAM protein with 4Fe4S-binding SPASM domain